MKYFRQTNRKPQPTKYNQLGTPVPVTQVAEQVTWELKFCVPEGSRVLDFLRWFQSIATLEIHMVLESAATLGGHMVLESAAMLEIHAVSFVLVLSEGCTACLGGYRCWDRWPLSTSRMQMVFRSVSWHMVATGSMSTSCCELSIFTFKY